MNENTEVKDNCEQIIMKYYIEKKGMKLIDFTRTPLEQCESFKTADIHIIESTNIEDILKKATGYDTDFNNDQTFVIEMTFEKKNNETKLIKFSKRKFDLAIDKDSDYTYDENGNPTHEEVILFKNTKKYKKYLELFTKINTAMLDALNAASTIEYLKSIQSRYDSKGDKINQIYNKMINIDKEQSIDNNPILKDYHLIIISIRDIIGSYDILHKLNADMIDNINIFKDVNDYGKFKIKINDLTKRMEILKEIDNLANIYNLPYIYNDKDLPFFTELIGLININLRDKYTNFKKNKIKRVQGGVKR